MRVFLVRGTPKILGDGAYMHDSKNNRTSGGE